MSEGIDTAIIDLAQSKIISAVSCIVVLDHWSESKEKLHSLDEVSIGLHLCLTGRKIRPLVQVKKACGYIDTSGYFLSPHRLFFNALCGRICQISLKEEIRAQFYFLTSALGALPQHIDSHHHCHQWPGISKTLLDFATTENLDLPIRQTSMPWRLFLHPGRLKFAWLSLWGRRFRGQLLKRGFKTQRYFGCYEDFYSLSYKRWMALLKRGLSVSESMLWAVHPACDTQGIRPFDSLEEPRIKEYRFLKSAATVKLLEAQMNRKCGDPPPKKKKFW